MYSKQKQFKETKVIVTELSFNVIECIPLWKGYI